MKKKAKQANIINLVIAEERELWRVYKEYVKIYGENSNVTKRAKARWSSIFTLLTKIESEG